MAAAARAQPHEASETPGPASVVGAPPDLGSAPPKNGHARLWRFERGSVRARLLTIAVLVAALVSLLLEVPGLNVVANEISHVSGGWLALAVVLELASCTSFVVVFRQFFRGIPARPARDLAWTEMGSGALLPGGGVGSLAVGGWLLHLAGMPTRTIIRNSSGLFFLTSAVNLAALTGGGVLLAAGLSAGRHDLLRTGLPILAGSAAIGMVLATRVLTGRRPLRFADSSWAGQLVAGIAAAERAVRRPSWRLAGAIGYLAFDIAVLWATLRAVGYTAPLAVLILGYIIGYLANLIPVPGAVGVLEGGLAGTLVLYGAPLTEATAGVLVYHAIAFWIPSIGGLLGYRRLRRHLATELVATTHTEANRPANHQPPSLAPGDTMQQRTNPNRQPVLDFPAARKQPSKPSRPSRARTGLRRRHLEAHAAAWLRSLRDTERLRS
ncbi:MAG: flippase-like protein [Solirubrobacterales bacterium]|nr:flippase-like protein [Solirubrobacterales bacterium]